MLQKLLGINWRTTMAGVLVIIGVVGKIIAALKVKDFAVVFTSAQELIPDVIAVLIAIGLMNSKDGKVIGAGDAAKTVHADGAVTNVEGEQVKAPVK